MLWPSRFRGLVILAVLVCLSWSAASPASAQKLLQSPSLAAAAPSLLGAPAYRGDPCLLLTAALCSNLPADNVGSLAASASNSMIPAGRPSLVTLGEPLPPPPSSAASPWSVGGLVSRFAHDQASIYAAPFERANLKWDAVFVAGTAALIASDRHTIGIVSHDDVNISRDISNVGLYGSGAAAGAIFVTGLLTDNAHARETGFLTAEALINAYPVYAGMQLIAGRERPDQGAGHGRFFQDHAVSTSFPSGHSMFTWTIASVIAHEYPRPWVKILAYSTAAAVSVSRYTGREHFVADVAVGGFIGYFLGRHIFNRHCSSEYNHGCHN